MHRRLPKNGLEETFNGKFRDECLNEHWFVNMSQARRVIENWRVEYNTERPHSSLGDLTPEEYADGVTEPSSKRISFDLSPDFEVDLELD